MSNIVIKVGFRPGVDIESAIIEAKNKCKLWGVACISFNFNGITLDVDSGSDVEDVYHEYQKQCSRQTKNYHHKSNFIYPDLDDIVPEMKLYYDGETIDSQVKWGGNDDPRMYLVTGVPYTVSNVQIKSWHTKIELEEFPGLKFNHVNFLKKV